MTPPFGPILLRLGPVTVHWYGILIVTGIILGANVAAYLAKSAGKDSEAIWDLLIFVVFVGIIGARLEYVLTPPHWDYYKTHLINILYIWEGGLRIYGAIIGGALSGIVYARVNNLRPLQVLDFVAPGMAIGQAIGRWGNFINQELYGPPTNLPWGLDIPLANRIPPYNDITQYPEATRFHPAFLYESLANFAICLLLIWISTRFRQQLKNGDITLWYLIGYSITRFLMDFLRTDGTSAQMLALVFIGVSVIALVVRHLPSAKASTAD